MAINIDTEKRKQLLDQGFFIFQRVLASGTVAKLNQMSRWMILIKKSLVTYTLEWYPLATPHSLVLSHYNLGIAVQHPVPQGL